MGVMASRPMDLMPNTKRLTPTPFTICPFLRHNRKGATAVSPFFLPRPNFTTLFHLL